MNEEERGGRSRVGRKEMRNYKENVMKRREVEGAEWGGKRGIIRRTLINRTNKPYDLNTLTSMCSCSALR